MTYKTIEEWIERNPGHIGAIPIEVCRQIWGTKDAQNMASKSTYKEQVETKDEPVAWMTINAYGEEDDIHYENPEGHLLEGWTYMPLYTHPLSVQSQPVSMRMPKAGDKVICLEDESLATVVSLTAGGSPDIVFSDGSRGTYLLREFAELFGYATPPQRTEQEPVEYCTAYYCAGDCGQPHNQKEMQEFLRAQPEQEQGEPVAWRLESGQAVWFERTDPEASSALPNDVTAIPLYTTPQPQREWVGLTDEEANQLWESTDSDWELMKRTEAKLKEKNT